MVTHPDPEFEQLLRSMVNEKPGPSGRTRLKKEKAVEIPLIQEATPQSAEEAIPKSAEEKIKRLRGQLDACHKEIYQLKQTIGGMIAKRTPSWKDAEIERLKNVLRELRSVIRHCEYRKQIW